MVTYTLHTVRQIYTGHLQSEKQSRQPQQRDRKITVTHSLPHVERHPGCHRKSTHHREVVVERTTHAESHTHTQTPPHLAHSSIDMAAIQGHHHIQTLVTAYTQDTHSQSYKDYPRTPRSLSQLHTETAVTYAKAIPESLLHPLPLVSQDQSPRIQTHVPLLLPTQLYRIHPEAYLIGNGEHQTMPSSQVLGVTHARSIPCHIDGKARARRPTHLVAGTLISHGKEGAMIIAVQGNVEHTARDRVGRGGHAWLVARHP